jgi:hypothetical protein
MAGNVKLHPERAVREIDKLEDIVESLAGISDAGDRANPDVARARPGSVTFDQARGAWQQETTSRTLAVIKEARKLTGDTNIVVRWMESVQDTASA